MRGGKGKTKTHKINAQTKKKETYFSNNPCGTVVKLTVLWEGVKYGSGCVQKKYTNFKQFQIYIV